MADILVTGGSGQVGTCLRQWPWPPGFRLIAPARARLDVADPACVEAMIASQPWAAVINCAAMTAVDRCETEIAAAWQVNALGPAALAQATARRNIPLLHVSTDHVFDGGKTGAYAETDSVTPLNVYGASKAGGEWAVRTGNPRHVILRTAWLVSPHGKNFIKTMLQGRAKDACLSVVDDQFGSPTHAGDLAGALAKIALCLIADPAAATGTYHFTSSGCVSWHGLALEIFRLAAAQGKMPPAIAAIATPQYPLPARRPVHSRLCCDRIGRDYAIFPRCWQDATREIVTDLLA